MESCRRRSSSQGHAAALSCVTEDADMQPYEHVGQVPKGPPPPEVMEREPEQPSKRSAVREGAEARAAAGAARPAAQPGRKGPRYGCGF